MEKIELIIENITKDVLVSYGVTTGSGGGSGATYPPTYKKEVDPRNLAEFLESIFTGGIPLTKLVKDHTTHL